MRERRQRTWNCDGGTLGLSGGFWEANIRLYDSFCGARLDLARRGREVMITTKVRVKNKDGNDGNGNNLFIASH